MEIASLKRYSTLLQIISTQDKQQKSLMFFTPAEELHGSNIFSRLSNHYNVIKPYLEVIDSEFIQDMNNQV